MKRPLQLDLQLFADENDLAMAVGNLTARMDQVQTDLTALTERIGMLESRQDWSRDDISAIWSELSSVREDVQEAVDEMAEQLVEPEPEVKKTETTETFDTTEVQPTPKKKRRWGVFD